jgi:hypothetical protein
MNEHQKVLTWIFAAAIAASIVFAPWEKSINSPDVGHVPHIPHFGSVIFHGPLGEQSL